MHWAKGFVGRSSRDTLNHIISKIRVMDNGTFQNITKLTNKKEDAALVHKAVASLASSSGGWDPVRKEYGAPSFLVDMESGINGRLPPEKNETDIPKEGPESAPYAWLKHEERPLQDIFDVVVCTGNLTFSPKPDFTDWNAFLIAWRPVLEGISLIIVQQGDPKVFLPVPEWVNFEIYTKTDAVRMMGKDAWIFDMDSDSPSARSFGLMAVEKELVFFLDRFSRPALDAAGKVINPLIAHAAALLTPATPYYYNTLYDPFHKVSDFSRGYPSTLRGGVPTLLSLGNVVDYADYDAATRAIKPAELEKRRPGTAQTIPHGHLFSLSTTNLAVHRGILGFALYFPSASLAAEYGYDVGDKNLEVLTGWFVKVIVDWVRGGCKHGGDGYVSALPPKPDRLIADIAFDINMASSGPVTLEKLSRWFAEIKLAVPVSKKYRDWTCKGCDGFLHDDTNLAAIHLLNAMDQAFGSIPFFKKYIIAFHLFNTHWKWQHAFVPKPEVLPIATRATLEPPSNSPHRCAVFTIMHDEPTMLPVWVRYYRRHFPGSVFIIDHMRNFTFLTPAERKAQEVDVASLQGPGGRDGLVRYYKLFGDQAGFPVHYFTWIAQMWMQRLLRAGHSCVMYSDMDEFLIAPNKTAHPNGLIDLLTEFSKDPQQTAWRAVAYTVAHVSESEDGKSEPLEPKLDWNHSLLAQRSYWQRTLRYDKPILSKYPLRWKPGFHTTFLKQPVISHNLNMLLLHLPEIDKDFCMKREAKKYAAMLISHHWETSGGWNKHILFDHALGKECRLGRAFLRGNQVVDHNKADILEKMSEAVKVVEL